MSPPSLIDHEDRNLLVQALRKFARHHTDGLAVNTEAQRRLYRERLAKAERARTLANRIERERRVEEARRQRDA